MVGDAMLQAGQAAEQANVSLARCPKDGTLASVGTKYCPECGSPMLHPEVITCPKCGAETKGAKFCPECGTKLNKSQGETNINYSGNHVDSTLRLV
jgi:predicted amidophosphoribosyltransferase